MSFIEKVADAALKRQTGFKTVTRASGALPQSTTGVLFRATGAIKVIEILGEVMTVIQTQTNNTKLLANPDTPATNTDLCATLDITADAVGTMYNITGTLADALVAQTNGAHIAQAGAVVVPAGNIELSCSASSTGAIKWSMIYVPLEEGATVVAA